MSAVSAPASRCGTGKPGARSEVFEGGRTLLVADINSSVQAALDAGADEVIVADTHSGGGNIRVDRMLDDTRVTYHERAAFDRRTVSCVCG